MVLCIGVEAGWQLTITILYFQGKNQAKFFNKIYPQQSKQLSCSVVLHPKICRKPHVKSITSTSHWEMFYILWVVTKGWKIRIESIADCQPWSTYFKASFFTGCKETCIRSNFSLGLFYLRNFSLKFFINFFQFFKFGLGPLSLLESVLDMGSKDNKET